MIFNISDTEEVVTDGWSQIDKKENDYFNNDEEEDYFVPENNIITSTEMDFKYSKGLVNYPDDDDEEDQFLLLGKKLPKTEIKLNIIGKREEIQQISEVIIEEEDRNRKRVKSTD